MHAIVLSLRILWFISASALRNTSRYLPVKHSAPRLHLGGRGEDAAEVDQTGHRHNYQQRSLKTEDRLSWRTGDTRSEAAAV